MTNQLKGVLITALGVLAIVPDSLMVRLIDADAMTIIFLRSGISCLVLMTYLLITRSIPKILSRAAIIFALSEAAGSFLFIVALENTSVASTLFLVSTAPVFSAIISWLVLRERLNRRMVWTIIGALVGVAIIASGASGDNAHKLTGDLAALGVAVSLAIAFTAVRHTPSLPIVPALTIAYALASLAGLILAPAYLLEGIEWLWIILNAAIFVPLGFVLMSMGPRYITAAEVSVILLLEAVLAPLLVWFVLGENPGSRVLLGGAVVLAVLLASNLYSLRKRRSSDLKP